MKTSNDPIQRLDQLRHLIESRSTSELQRQTRKLLVADLAELIEGLDRTEAAFLFKTLPEVQKAKLFGTLSSTYQNYIIRSLDIETAARLLGETPQSERHLFLKHMPRVRLRRLLEEMTAEERAEWQRYSEDELGHWASPDVFVAQPDWTVQETIQALKARTPEQEVVFYVYIVDGDNRLLDRLSIQRIATEEPQTQLTALMDHETAMLSASDPLDVVFDRFETRDAESMPVVDADQRLVGLIHADDVMHLRQDRLSQEWQRSGGMSVTDVPYLESSIWDQLVKRGGWLALLFVGEMLTATVMTSYEAELEQAVVLALFLPLILSSGGNSGSQSSTLIIRALALREFQLSDWPIIFRRELITGVTLGVFLGLIGLVRILFWDYLGWADYTEHGKFNAFDVSLAVTVGVMGIVAWGNLIGSLLPLGLRALRLDPAAISAPFLATFVDVTGLILYFSFASAVLDV
ncbi:magnesium transporter [Thiohalocapsa halophila]